MENAPVVKANEANLAELNKKIIEIKRKIVLKGEQLIVLVFRAQKRRNKKVLFFMTCFLFIALIIITFFQRVKRKLISRNG
jgi:hypothetical protein